MRLIRAMAGMVVTALVPRKRAPKSITGNVIKARENGVLKTIVKLSPERGKIRKFYAQERDRSRFENEVRLLKKFDGHPNFPALLGVDENKRTFHEEYCENWQAEICPSDWREQIEDICENFLVRQIIPGDLLNTHHCLIKNGKLKVIDMEHFVDLSHLSREAFLASDRLEELWKSKLSLISSFEKQIARFHREPCGQILDMTKVQPNAPKCE